jgi:hypothetical protein
LLGQVASQYGKCRANGLNEIRCEPQRQERHAIAK